MKKTYIIYRDEDFFAYTSSKFLLKSFLETRKGDYSYRKFDMIPYKLRQSDVFKNGELIIKEINGEMFVLTYGEEQILTEYICDEMAGLHFMLYELINDLEKCKFDTIDEKIVFDGLEIALAKVESAHSDFHSVMYEQVVDIPRVLKKSQGISPLRKKHRKPL